MGLSIFVCVHSEVVVCLDQGGKFRDIGSHTAPHGRRSGNGVDVELCDNTKVVTTTSESPVKIWERVLADIDDESRRSDYLIRDDIVACQTVHT